MRRIAWTAAAVAVAVLATAATVAAAIAGLYSLLLPGGGPAEGPPVFLPGAVAIILAVGLWSAAGWLWSRSHSDDE